MDTRNIEFVKAGSSANLIENPERMSGNNRSANGWLAQGNHWQTDVDTNGWLHIISDGRGDNRPNRVEVDPGMNRNDVCEIRFEAKWVTGSPSSSSPPGITASRTISSFPSPTIQAPQAKPMEPARIVHPPSWHL